jgi:hypothetical protein
MVSKITFDEAVETLEELRMVPTIANDNLGNVIDLENYRKPVDTRASEFFDALADEFLGEDVICVSVVLVAKDSNGQLIFKERFMNTC